MKTIKRILVAIKDPASRRQTALPKAAQLAAGSGARLELFHAITQPLYLDALTAQGQDLRHTQQEWRAGVVRQLEKHAEKLRVAGIDVDCACDWDFPAYEAVVRRAARIKADLIVAELHPTRHVLPTLLRFNDWELVRRSPVPVLLIKRPGTWRKPVVLSAIDPQHAFAKPAQLDEAILDAGAAVAEAIGGTQHVVHAFPAPTQATIDLGVIAPLFVPSAGKRALAEARKAFDRELGRRDIPRARRHLVPGHPIDVIPSLARRRRASLVVMGGISRSGIRRLVIGNIAEQVLDALPCDVLVLKPAKFKSPVKGHSRGVQLLATPPYV